LLRGKWGVVRGRKPTVDDRTLLIHIAVTPDPFVSTSELADFYGMSTQGMGQRLRDLEDRGLIRSKKAGSGNAWFLSRDGQEDAFEAWQETQQASSSGR
jgi:predicted transcriptional regulator